MYPYRFGSNIIYFAKKDNSSREFQCCYSPVVSFANKTEFENEDKRIVIGGKPLTLKIYKDKVADPRSKDPSNPNYFKPHAIECIYINNISPIDTSDIINNSFVLDDNKLSRLLKNSTVKGDVGMFSIIIE